MFEILEHTADIGFRVRGSSLPELFEQAALALETVAVDTRDVQQKAAYPIAASGGSQEELLVNWLNEVLYYLDGERVVMGRVQVEQLEDCRITGLGWGEPREDTRHAPKLVVKGVTYHQLKITRDEDGWSADVFLDV